MTSEPTGPKPTEGGYVYVLSHTKQPGVCKIGCTKYPKDRLKAFNTGCSERGYKYEELLFFEDYQSIEKLIHWYLGGYRHDPTEWFAVAPVDAVFMLRNLHRRSNPSDTNDPTGRDDHETKPEEEVRDCQLRFDY